MSMFRLNHVEDNLAYRAEMLQRAERRRFAREALAGERGRVAFYAPVLVGVGNRMIAWGAALQARYASASEQHQPRWNETSRLQPDIR